ncbi:MAG: prolipoprotein diacylglyceryl transferase [Clostridia bacterium]|nr:prolipoprotein diacylglyceryl transferase [Clostridia bacterium]
MFDFSQKAITVFGFEIHFYGIIIVLGVYLAILLSEKREVKMGFQKETVLSLALWALPAAIICARCYYVLFNFDEYRGDLVSIFNIRAGGMAIYGGLIGGILTGFIYAKRKKLSFVKLFDLAAPSIALGQAVGRWGNFVNHEAYGIEITHPSLQFFPVSVFIPSENAYFAATFFYESLWCFLIVILCLIFEKKRLFKFTGAEAIFYISMYAFERMIVEGLRTDSLYFGFIRISQLLSILALLAVAVITIFKSKKSKRLPPAALTALAFAVISLSILGYLPYFALIASGAIALSVCLIGIFRAE